MMTRYVPWPLRDPSTCNESFLLWGAWPRQIAAHSHCFEWFFARRKDWCGESALYPCARIREERLQGDQGAGGAGTP